MLAYADGKEIEVRKGDKWFPSDTVVFNWCDFRYRIKPQPKYRPFKDAEECWQEMQKHQPFGWVKDRDGGYFLIVDVRDETSREGEKSLFINVSDDGEEEPTADYLMEEYTFADGEPFGVKEEGV